MALGLFAALSACQTMPPPEDAAPVAHFVAVWLRDPADITARERLAAQTEAWRTFPGVLFVACGDAVPGMRPVNRDHDFGVLIVFADEAALRAYETDPAHEQAVREVLRPLVARVEVFDFQLADVPTNGETGLPRAVLRKRQYRRYSEFAN